jgi:Tfp pilus assembly protein PilF
LNNIQDAIKNFDKAIELDPEFSWNFLQRGHAFLKIGERDRAAQDFKKAANMGNEQAQAYLQKKGIQ